MDCEADFYDWHRAFNFVSGEGRDTVLAGLTVKNGVAPLIQAAPPPGGGQGAWINIGGAIVIKGASPTIDRCVFVNNLAFASGGAIESTGVVTMADAGTPRIVGCTFRENANREGWGICGTGGAIDCGGGGAEIEGCSFFRNECECSFAPVGGGAISAWGADLVIRGCEFYQNAGVGMETLGGALFAIGSTVTLMDCTLSGNSVGSAGAGGALVLGYDQFWMHAGSHGTLTNCVLTGNVATYGAVFSTGSDPTPPLSTLRVVNCTIKSNRGVSGQVLDWRFGTAEFTNSIIWNDIDWWGAGAVTVSYSNIEGWWPGTGNIFAQPLFMDEGHWDDNGTPDDPSDDFWVNGDYHLLAGSPEIDAASNAAVPRDTLDLDADGCVRERVPVDLGGHARFQDDPATPDTGFGGPPLVDMGAYEFGDSPPPNPAACDGDLNCDGVLDFDDINPFVLALSDPGSYQTQFPDCFLAAGDVNGDGAVDFDDINPFVGLLAGP